MITYLFLPVLNLIVIRKHFAGVIGIETSIRMINNHEFMGFLGFCSSQWFRAKRGHEKWKIDKKISTKFLCVNIHIYIYHQESVGQHLVDQCLEGLVSLLWRNKGHLKQRCWVFSIIRYVWSFKMLAPR